MQTDLTPEQLVIAQIRATPEQTVAAWTLLPDNVFNLDWGRIALLATQHRVEGILEESLKLAGCADQVAPSVLSTLRRRAGLAEARYQGCYEALTDLQRIAPDLVSGLIFFKGATLVPLYDSPQHRMLGDFDLIVAEDHLAQLQESMAELGFWEKSGRNGPTFFGKGRNPQIGAEHVCFDVHIASPPKYNRTDSSLDAVWLEDTFAYELGEVKCRRLSTELELLELIVHASEHATSWIHVCLDDDVRLVRLLDIELLCARHEVDSAKLALLCDKLGLDGEMALGLAQLAALRGELPAPLKDMQAHADAGAPFVDHVALPDGRLDRFAAPLRTRAFEIDRAAQALQMMPSGQQNRRHWFDWRRGLIHGREDVAAVAALASERLAKIRAA